jgi:hypothetical protein
VGVATEYAQKILGIQFSRKWAVVEHGIPVKSVVCIWGMSIIDVATFNPFSWNLMLLQIHLVERRESKFVWRGSRAE